MATKKLISSKNTLSVGILTLTLIGMTACTSTQKLLEPKSVVTPQSIYKVKPVKFNDGGIWPGDTTKNLLFEDTRARKVGDLVTVVLNETATSTQTATTDTSKSSSIDLKTESMLGLPSNMNVTY